MGEKSKIEWCDHTFNPWIGCTEVSPACDHCYARAMMQDRYKRVEWGNHPRVRTSESNWRKPLHWNENARLAGVRARVFCASLADVFDNQVDPAWREDLWTLIRETPHLTWMLLTKRPQNIFDMLPMDWGLPGLGRGPFAHVWLGTTVEDQPAADRNIWHLIQVAARVHFLSCEPLLGPLALALDMIDLVITGGETGPGARFTPPARFRAVRDRCQAAGVAYFHKQNGDWIDADQWFDIANSGPAKIVTGPDGLPWQPARPLNFDDAARLAAIYGFRKIIHNSDGTTAMRVGKAAAGATLDGRLHRAFPA